MRLEASLWAMQVVLVRHPPPDIPPGVCYGRLDLTVRTTDAVRIGAQLAALNLTLAWSSPALRCRMVAEASGLPVRHDTRLLELDFGAWEGVTWDGVPREALDRWAADPLGFAPPGGESGAQLLARVRDMHRAILAENADCAVVSHGGPLRLLAALLRGEAPDLLAQAPPIGSVQAFTV